MLRSHGMRTCATRRHCTSSITRCPPLLILDSVHCLLKMDLRDDRVLALVSMGDSTVFPQAINLICRPRLLPRHLAQICRPLRAVSLAMAIGYLQSRKTMSGLHRSSARHHVMSTDSFLCPITTQLHAANSAPVIGTAERKVCRLMPYLMSSLRLPLRHRIEPTCKRGSLEQSFELGK
jgi:hypothetical protein